jgi:hypothetical protein
VNPTHLDQLRDALRRETEQLQPVGLGVENVKRRGSRRRNRGRALVAVATVTCLAGAGVALSHRNGGKHVVDVGSQTGTPPPALQFRVVNGEVNYATHFTASDGVTYALSTAPKGVGTPTQPGQAIYSTKDGEHWTTADQGQPWISDLTEANGVLYAVGTAPGTGANDVQYHVGTSHDRGQQWVDSNLPFDQSTPSATVSLNRSASVHLARNASTTVALLTEQFSPDLDAMVAARTAGHDNVSTQQTANGFDLVDLGTCMSAKPSLDPAGVASTTTIPTDAGKRLEANCTNASVLGTISWSDIGLNSAADLSRQQMLVSNDGTHWGHATAPAIGFVTDLVASGDGFLLLADRGRTFQGPGAGPGTESTLMRSTDAQSWTNVATPAGLGVQAIAGDRVIGADGAGVVQTSSDGGATWTATSLGSQLPAGTPEPTGTITDAGPLGFAVVVTADANPKDATRGYDYLLFSTDGITWSTNDLAAAGAPDAAYPMQVIVGADHIGVDYEGPFAAPNGPMRITTLLATPTR